MSTGTASPLLESGHAVDPQNPWPGLNAFTEALHDYFHGRTCETDELFRSVKRDVLTVLFGQSGLGKTSLLQAGLFPRLRREGFLPVAIRLSLDPQAPGLVRQVKEAVVGALKAERSAMPPPTPEETLWEYFHRLDRGGGRDGEPVSLVLAFDQFEELFTLGQARAGGDSRTAPLLTELADLVENRPPAALELWLGVKPDLVEDFVFDRQDYRVLLSLREDYLPHLEGLRERMPAIAHNRMRLTRMTGRQAFEAVIEPGRELVSPAVARQIVRFVAGVSPRERATSNGPGEEEDLAGLEVEPALLSLVCRELNNRRLGLGLGQITADLLAGSSERILHDYYERCVEYQVPAVRAFIEDELLTDSGFRENMALERARRLLAQRGAPASALDVLVQRRLLHVEERFEVQRVELTHDVLTDVIKKSRDERQQREAAEDAQRRESQIREQLRQSRRQLMLVVAAATAVVAVILGFSMFSYYQWKRAELTSYFNLVALAERESSTGLYRRTEKLLARCPPDLRHWEWHYLKRLCDTTRHRLHGHTDDVIRVAFSPDGQRLASASSDTTVRVWDVATGREVLALLGHTDRVWGLAFNADGTRLASASWDRTVRVWNVADGDKNAGQECLTPRRHDSFVNGAAFSPDGRHLVSVSADGVVKGWVAATGESWFKDPPPQTGIMRDVAFSPDGRRFATACGVWVKVWDVEKVLQAGSEPQPLLLYKYDHDASVYGVAFSPDGRYLASGGTDRVIQLRDARTGEPLFRLSKHNDTVRAVAFSPDSRQLASASSDKLVILWDTATGRDQRILRGHRSYVNGVGFNPDGRLLASASYDHTAKIWDLATGKVRTTLERYLDPVGGGASLPKDRSPTSTGNDRTDRVGDEIRDMESLVLRGHEDRTSGVAFSPDDGGRLLASASYDHTVRIWNATTGEPIQPLDEHTDFVSNVVFSPSGRRLASSSYDGTVRFWRRNGQNRFEEEKESVLRPNAGAGEKTPILDVAFSPPDGRHLAAGGRDGIVRVWDVTMTPPHPLWPDDEKHRHPEGIRRLAFSPDGKWLASAGSDKTVKVWDATTGVLRYDLPGHDQPVYRVTFSHDGRYLASGSMDRTVKIWHVATGREVRTLDGHTGSIRAVAFSPDGRRLFSASWDEAVKVWDVATGLEALTLRGHMGMISDAALSPDGYRLAVTGEDTTVRIWDATPLAPDKRTPPQSSALPPETLPPRRQPSIESP